MKDEGYSEKWRRVIDNRGITTAVNSYPANWSEEKAKKESKKSGKNTLG